MGFLKRRKDQARLQKVLEDAKITETLDQIMEKNSDSGLLDRCEQVMENAREIDDGKKEYYIITSYLNDIELIENLAPDQAEEIRKAAENVTKLNKARDRFLNTSRRISDAQFQMIQRMEDEIPDAVRKLRENEDYQSAVKRDMQYLEGEKQEWEIQKRECRRQLAVLRKASVLLLSAAVTVLVLLMVLSAGFRYDMQYAWIGAILAAVLGAAFIVLRLESSRRDIRQAEVNINYAITLLNKVKIRYVVITNAVDYACEKYHVRDSKEFSYQWDMYQEAVREQQKYLQTNEDLNYYYSRLVSLLKKCELYDSRVWMEQPQALIDPKEMVEIKHGLLVRRQKLRSKMAYNLDIVKKERKDIIQTLKKAKQADPKILEMIVSIDKLAGFA